MFWGRISLTETFSLSHGRLRITAIMSSFCMPPLKQIHPPEKEEKMCSCLHCNIQRFWEMKNINLQALIVIIPFTENVVNRL